jgi:hypothetical protein
MRIVAPDRTFVYMHISQKISPPLGVSAQLAVIIHFA